MSYDDIRLKTINYCPDFSVPDGVARPINGWLVGDRLDLFRRGLTPKLGRIPMQAGNGYWEEPDLAKVGWVGVPVYASSLYGFLTLSALIPVFLNRIRMEERMLTEEFGDAYRNYEGVTSKLIPFIY